MEANDHGSQRSGHGRRQRAHTVLLLAGCGVIGVLAAVPWHTYAISVRGAGSFRLDRTGLESPEKGLGRAALVAAVVLVVVVGVVLARRRTQPDLGPRSDALVILASLAVAGLLGGKFLQNTDFLGTGAWISLALGVVMVWCGLSLRRTSG